MRERTAELERSNDELQKFASFLSHELRQPLGTQMIWIELLESQAAGALDETARRNLENIRAMALKMSELISAQIALAPSPRRGGEPARGSRRGGARGDHRGLPSVEASARR